MTPFRQFLICASFVALAAPAASFAWASDNVQSVRAAVGIGTAAASALPTGSLASASAPGMQLPATPPRLVDRKFNSYGYTTPARLSAQLIAESRKHQGGAVASAAGGSTVTVTAVVLPVHTIVVRGGVIRSIYSNTNAPKAAGSLWIVRADTIDGATQELDAQLWAQVCAKLAHTRAGVGKIA